jgi:hypothetical protein
MATYNFKKGREGGGAEIAAAGVAATNRYSLFQFNTWLHSVPH